MVIAMRKRFVKSVFVYPLLGLLCQFFLYSSSPVPQNTKLKKDLGVIREEAEAQFQKKNYSHAAVRFQEWFDELGKSGRKPEEEPGYVSVLAKYGACRAEVGDLGEAGRLIARAFLLEPKLDVSAAAYPESAVRLFREIGQVQAEAAAGERSIAGGDLDEAYQQLQVSARKMREFEVEKILSGPLVQALMNLAIQKMKRGGIEEARPVFAEILALDSAYRPDPDLYSQKIVGEFERAAREFRKVDPQSPWVSTAAAPVKAEKVSRPIGMVQKDGKKPGGKKKSIVAWIVVGVAVVAAGIGLYFLLKKDNRPGVILVHSKPEGASIFLDGQDTGKKTNARLENVPRGTHTVKLTFHGYDDYETTVSVSHKNTPVISVDLTSKFKLVATIGPNGNGGGEFVNAAGIAVNKQLGHIYVLDTISPISKVYKFNTNGQVIGNWSLPSNILTYVSTSLKLDIIGNLFVGGLQYVQKYTSNGDLIKYWGDPRQESNRFRGIDAFTIDQIGNVIVSPGFDTKLLKFNEDGVVLETWDYQNGGNEMFRSPHDMCLDQNGNIVAVDYTYSHVQFLSTSGQLLEKWYPKDEANQPLTHIAKIAYDFSNQLIYVSQYSTYYVYQYNFQKQFLFKCPLSGYQQIRYIACDAQGFLYLTTDKYMQKYATH